MVFSRVPESKQTIMKPVVFLLACFLWLPTAFASWSPKNYPNPNTDVYKCGRNGVRSWVCDPDGVIPYESANVVEGVIKEINAGRPPYALGPCGRAGPQGYQVAVALMRRMRFSGDATAAAKEFATAVHDRWGVGDRRCDNGVVLLFSIADRQMYISAGAGTLNLLTYDVLGDILDDVRPILRKHRYGEAVERAVVDIGLALAGRPVEPQADTRDKFGKDDAIALGVFVVAAGGMVFFAHRNQSRRQRRYNDCKSKLEKIKRDQAALRAGSPYNPTSCPVCLEDFTPEPASPGGGNGNGGGNGGGGEAAAAAQGPGGASASTASGAAATAADGPSSARSAAAAAAIARAAATNSAARTQESGSVEMGHGCKNGCKGHGESEGELRKPLLGGEGGDAGSGGGGAAAAAAAGGDAAAGGGSTGGETGSQRRPLVLPCGHAFCEPCISKWLDQKKITCPICRRPIDEEDTATDPSAPTQPRQPPPSQRPGGGAGPSSSGAGGSGSGAGAGPSRPPCSVDDEDDYTAAAAAAAAATQDRRGWGFGGGSWGIGLGAPVHSHTYGAYGSPRLRLRWGGRRRGIRMHEDLMLAEMMFRLRQLQRQHPDYISDSMVNNWGEDIRAGRELSASQLRDFQLRDPANRSNLASSGRAGNSIRFGGGSSRGGGGRGGSW